MGERRARPIRTWRRYNLGLLGTPAEVAGVIVFFASDAASFITGQTLSVDGGPHLGGIDTD